MNEFDPPIYPSSPSLDPSFVRASDWLSRTGIDPIAILVGVPFSHLSLSKARCDLLPKELRIAMASFSTYSPTLGVDLAETEVLDVGDIRISEDVDESMDVIGMAIERLSSRYSMPFALLGGDNSITAPAASKLIGTEGSLITFDAHHDLRDYKTSGLSNGSPVRVLLDEGLKGENIWQIGIKDFANSKTYSDFAHHAGIKIVSLPEVRQAGIEGFVIEALDALPGPVYIDMDLDVVDRSLAPGAPAAQPGGLHPSQVAYAAFLCGKHPSVRAIDIVEVDPSRDVAGATVRLAGLVLLSFFAGVALRGEV